MRKKRPATKIFYGEIGVELRAGVAPARDDTPAGDPSDPSGDEWSRRNYLETSYQSGMPKLEPGEYELGGRDFYRDYFDRAPPPPLRRPQSPAATDVAAAKAAP